MRRKLVLANAPQPEMLRQYLERQSIGHGQTITADIQNVRLRKETKGTVSMYFCPMKGIEVKEKFGTPDGSEIPEKVELHGTLLTSRKIESGLYNLKNAQIYTNGAMHVTVGIDSSLELVEAEYY